MEVPQRRREPCRVSPEGLLASVPYNLSLYMPECRPLTFASILLANSGCPLGNTKKRRTIAALGSAGTILSGYLLSRIHPFADQVVSAAIYITSINLVWHETLKLLDKDVRGTKRAFVGSLLGAGSFLAAPYITKSPALAGIINSVGFALGNLLAIPPDSKVTRIEALTVATMLNVVSLTGHFLFGNLSSKPKEAQAVVYGLYSAVNLVTLLSVGSLAYYGLKKRLEASTVPADPQQDFEPPPVINVNPTNGDKDPQETALVAYAHLADAPPPSSRALIPVA